MIKLIVIMIIFIQVSLLNTNETFFNNLDADSFHDKLQNLDPEEFLLIDIRTPQEFNAGHIEAAVMIDFYEKNFIKNLSELPKDKYYLIYCRSGRRTGITLQYMKQLGFQKVDDLKGGIITWLEAGFQLTTD